MNREGVDAGQGQDDLRRVVSQAMSALRAPSVSQIRPVPLWFRGGGPRGPGCRGWRRPGWRMRARDICRIRDRRF